MSCPETQDLIHAYLDGELDLVRSLEIESHLRDCTACSAVHTHFLALRAALHDERLYHKAPPALRRRVHAALHQRDYRRWLALAASVAVVGAGLWRFQSAPSAEDEMVREVFSSHVRSLQPNHLTDVLSSNQHTVKPWFAGRLDFSPAVKDLAAQGFPLVGARLDYLGGRPVAALVYQRRKHLINVFVWPSARDSRSRETARQGYHLLHWGESGMAFWVVSDLNPGELRQFAQLLR